jgi:hypothetical protein
VGAGHGGGQPNALVAITDDPATAAPAGDEAFHTVVAPRYARVVRGVALTPDSEKGGGWRGFAVRASHRRARGRQAQAGA